MKSVILSAVAAGALSLPAIAADVAPADVVFEEGAISAPLSGMAGNPDEGAKVVSTKSIGNCVSCHEVTALSDVPFQGEIGPSLDGAGSRWSEQELRGIVANAKNTFDESMMPSFYKVDGFIRPGNGYSGKAIAVEEITPLLSAQQIEDVVAYLVTLKDE